jgi:hypothetical protein
VLRYLYSEPLGGFDYALPGLVSFSVANALYLVEASYGVSHMTGVDQRFLSLLRKGKLVAVQSVLLSRAQSFRHPDSSLTFHKSDAIIRLLKKGRQPSPWQGRGAFR